MPVGMPLWATLLFAGGYVLIYLIGCRVEDWFERRRANAVSAHSAY